MPEGYRRLHPLTPVLRGWKFVAAVVAIAVQQTYGSVSPGYLLLVVAASIPVGVAYGYVAWRRTRFRVTQEDLRLETGVLFRRSRQVRLDRLQAVDVVRPLVARALGLAELRLEVAGGSSSEAPLAYLSEPAAQQLRAELLARAAGLEHGQEEAPTAPERVLLTVPLTHLIESQLRSGTLIVGPRGRSRAGRVRRGHRRPGAARTRRAVAARRGPGDGQRDRRAVRLHRRRVAGRPAAAPRAARDALPDRAAGTGAGRADRGTPAVALPRLVPRRGERRGVRRGGTEQGVGPAAGRQPGPGRRADPARAARAGRRRRAAHRCAPPGPVVRPAAVASARGRDRRARPGGPPRSLAAGDRRRPARQGAEHPADPGPGAAPAAPGDRPRGHHAGPGPGHRRAPGRPRCPVPARFGDRPGPPGPGGGQTGSVDATPSTSRWFYREHGEEPALRGRRCPRARGRRRGRRPRRGLRLARRRGARRPVGHAGPARPRGRGVPRRPLPGARPAPGDVTGDLARADQPVAGAVVRAGQPGAARPPPRTPVVRPAAGRPVRGLQRLAPEPDDGERAAGAHPAAVARRPVVRPRPRGAAAPPDPADDGRAARPGGPSGPAST